MDENKYLRWEFVFWTPSITADADDASLRVFGLCAFPPHNQMNGYTHDLIKGAALTSTQPPVYLRRVRRLRPPPWALTPMNMVPLFAFHLTDIGSRIINSENELIFTTCPRVDIELWSWGVHSEPVNGGL